MSTRELTFIEEDAEVDKSSCRNVSYSDIP